MPAGKTWWVSAAALLAAATTVPAEEIQIRENAPDATVSRQQRIRITAQPPAAVEAGNPAAAGSRTMPLEEQFALTVLAPVSQMQANMKTGVRLEFDMQTVGALVMSDSLAELNVQPAGLTLPFGGPKPGLELKYDAAAKRLMILMNGSPCVQPSPLELRADRATRLCIRQRDQLALYAIPPDGSACVLAWCGRFDYRIRLMVADRYRLCRDVSVKMKGRAMKAEELSAGVTVDALDEIGDIVVSGKSPLGAPFEHCYKVDLAKLGQAVGQSLELFRQSLLQPPAAKKEGAP